VLGWFKSTSPPISPEGFRDALFNAPCEALRDALREAMSERIALLAGRIEQRKRAKMGIPQMGRRMRRPRQRIAGDPPSTCQKMPYFFFFLPTDVSCPPLIAFNPSKASLQSLPVAFSAPASIHF
jgi:hypothetical protein